MLKECFKDNKDNPREGDYLIVSELLYKKLDLDYNNRTIDVYKHIYDEIKECTKILRYTLKCFLKHNSHDENVYNAIIIDTIWKIMLLNIEALIDKYNISLKSNEENFKNYLATTNTKIKEIIHRTNIEEKNLELNYTIKEDKLKNEIKDLKQIIENKNNEIMNKDYLIDELTNSTRFMHIHFFLYEFQNKITSEYDINLSVLKTTKNILELMLRCDLSKELNDELSTNEMEFPKWTIKVLRKLKEFLRITSGEIRMKLKNVKERIKNIFQGNFIKKEFADQFAQTIRLKGLELKVVL